MHPTFRTHLEPWRGEKFGPVRKIIGYSEIASERANGASVQQETGSFVGQMLNQGPQKQQKGANLSKHTQVLFGRKFAGHKPQADLENLGGHF